MNEMNVQKKELRVNTSVLLDPAVIRAIRLVRAENMLNDHEMSRSEYINQVLRQHLGLDVPEVKS
jgi:hypothetical protein